VSAVRGIAQIRRLRDAGALATILGPFRSFAAYALAYLEPQLFPLAEFFEATAGRKRALVMHARGGLGPSTVAMGSPDLVQTILQLHPGPRQTFLTCEPDHVDNLLLSHDLWRPQTMLRMQTSRDAFNAPGPRPEVRRLLGADAADLNRLYAIEEDGLRYSSRQLETGLSYGAFSRGRLVAAAGTHIYSLHQKVAIIGNVFTHPDFRGHGFGTAVTAAVTDHLLQACDLVVLNVDPANRTARHIYERLGFSEAARLVEAVATRRHLLSPGSFLKRKFARWRANAPDTETVSL
jgi:RimJ/RimL family protein N-acetyltransferase